MISGLLLLKWPWPSIFWFLSIASPAVLLVMILFLPETCRTVVGNGSIPMAWWNTPLITTLCPRGHELVPKQKKQEKQPEDFPKLTNPLSVLTLFRHRGTLAIFVCFGIYYMVHTCLQASLSTIFVEVYHISGLVAGLVYIPFGVACMIASYVAGLCCLFHETFLQSYDAY